MHTGLTVESPLDDPAGRAILSKHTGGSLLLVDMSRAKDMTLEQIAGSHPTFLSQHLLENFGLEVASAA